jgi:putative nucleotidyltransferase with HDIG domain
VSDKKEAVIDRAQVKRAAQNSIPLSVKTFTLPHETEEYLAELLEVFLTELGHAEIKDPLVYCLRELAVNAKKANTKRVYFVEKGLDIGDPKEYETGMKHFKEDTLENIQHYLQKQKDMGLYVKVTFQATGKDLVITVRNNVEITRKEQIRVYDRIARSRAFKSMEEAFATVLDSSEGAGLGIVILALMLKKIGLDEESFGIDTSDGETIATISLPISKIHMEKVNLLTEAIVREVDQLPQFPENIVHIQKMVNDPDSEIADIARQFSSDPSLTGELLKLVNSAQFMVPKRVDNIVEAVKLLGMKNIKNLLYTHGTQKVLGERYSHMQALWDHCYRCAMYSYQLARNFKKRKDLLDDAYVGGILHDLGTIVVSSLHPELLDKIRRFCKEKDIGAGLIEDISVGLNHAEVGALIATKWNFPKELVQAIRFHHRPLECDSQYQEVVFCVYLANAICDLQRDRLTYEQMDEAVLQDFGITSEERLTSIGDKLDKFFASQRSGF